MGVTNIGDKIHKFHNILLGVKQHFTKARNKNEILKFSVCRPIFLELPREMRPSVMIRTTPLLRNLTAKHALFGTVCVVAPPPLPLKWHFL